MCRADNVKGGSSREARLETVVWRRAWHLSIIQGGDNLSPSSTLSFEVGEDD
jgi:hypothetical protein